MRVGVLVHLCLEYLFNGCGGGALYSRGRPCFVLDCEGVEVILDKAIVDVCEVMVNIIRVAFARTRALGIEAGVAGFAASSI